MVFGSDEIFRNTMSFISNCEEQLYTVIREDYDNRYITRYHNRVTRRIKMRRKLIVGSFFDFLAKYSIDRRFGSVHSATSSFPWYTWSLQIQKGATCQRVHGPHGSDSSQERRSKGTVLIATQLS